MSDAFEKKFREKLSEGDIPFDADAWNKMEKKLDALNEDGSSRKSFWKWLAPLLLLLLGTGAFFWWHSAISPNEQSSVVSSNNAATPQQQMQNDSPEEKTTTDNNNQPAAAPAQEEKTLSPATPAPGTKINKDNSTAPAATPAGDKNRIPSSPLAERRKATAANKEQDNILQLLSTLQPKEEQIAANVKSSAGIPVKETPKAADEKIKAKKELPSRKGFSLTLTGGPVYNVAPSLQYGRLGIDGGLLLSYHVNNHWSFTSGAIYSHKPYGGTWKDYGVLKKWPTPDPYHVVRKIDANCGVLDVPININYAFMNRPEYTLSATAGLSSYFMLKENYNYKYQTGWDKEYEFTNANRHYLAVLNLAFTYQFPLNKNTSLGIQPFAKIPFRPVGYGEVKLYSTGVMLQLNFNAARPRR